MIKKLALTNREITVIFLRKATPKINTLEKIAQLLGVTRERIRQIEARAELKMMRIAEEETKGDLTYPTW